MAADGTALLCINEGMYSYQSLKLFRSGLFLQTPNAATVHRIYWLLRSKTSRTTFTETVKKFAHTNV
jgi:hypothetical protein